MLIVLLSMELTERDEVNYITDTPWRFYFDGWACKDGQAIGVVIVSPKGAIFEMSSRLNYF